MEVGRCLRRGNARGLSWVKSMVAPAEFEQLGAEVLSMLRCLSRVVVLLALSAAATAVLAQPNLACGSLEKGYGPFDYRTDKDKLGIVEQYHFTTEVETLRRGKTTTKIGGDLAYTLRAFPNHHRALMAMVKLAQREGTTKPEGSTFTVDCWFERAERFRANDGMVKVVYGLYLLNRNQNKEAIDKLMQAKELGADDANIHYNLGLAFMRVKDYDHALESAHRAYALGYPLPGLRDQLRRQGKWREP